MPTIYKLQLASVTPLREIEGLAHSIWTYALTWDQSAAATIPIDLGPQIAVEFSARIAIKDPKSLPDVPAIQSTLVDRPAKSDLLRVRRDVQGHVGNSLTLSFVAPSATDTFTVVRLAQQVSIAGVWVEVPFYAPPAGDSALQQVLTGPAVVCPSSNASVVLEHSTRSINKATIGSFLIPLDTSAGRSSSSAGDALAKYRFARQLVLQPGEVRAVREHVASHKELHADSTALATLPWEQLSRFELDPNAQAQAPKLGGLSQVPINALLAFGKAVATLRQEDLARKSSAPLKVALARTAAIATTGLSLNATGRGIQPIGYLNLERLEMAPAGIVRGELVATIPLAPLEETAVVQKEWSVTSKEFTSIVTDSLENYSETGVTDNTELAQSTTSQNQHSNQFNITGTVSGGIEQIFDASATSGFTAQDTSSSSATASAKHSASLTQKASSRVKKEHKVTISTTTVTGTSESTTRTLKNPDPVNPMRIDYFRMMREWRVRLYRYGLRLTYDLVIAEPGGAFRQAQAYLGWLKSQLGPFQFSIPLDQVTLDNYAQVQQWATRYAAQLPAVPVAQDDTRVGIALKDDGNANEVRIESIDPINVPEGNWIEHLMISMRLENSSGSEGGKLSVLFSGLPEQHSGANAKANVGPFDLTQTSEKYMFHAGGKCVVMLSHHDLQHSACELRAVFTVNQEAKDKWQSDAWSALFNAAQSQYYTNQQDIAAKISQLEERLNGVDTLTLRREESEEIMKLAVANLVGSRVGQYWGNEEVYAWLANFIESQTGWPPIVDPATPFAPGLPTDPRPLGAAFTRVSDPEVFNLLPLVEQNEITTRFINQAIEWENVVTFLYSYCWDTPESWEFIRNLQHADATRQAFLRAGSARVVLTVRKGWEQMWNAFVQTGLPYYVGDKDPSNNDIPYMTIAQEIAAYDDRNYPGIAPANPGQSAVRLEESVYTTSTTVLSPPAPTPQVPNPPPLLDVEIEVASNVGFLVGAQVVIDSGVGEGYPPYSWGRQETTTIMEIPANDTRHITLASIQNSHGGNRNAYAVVQPGIKGVLIAEWKEYTPTSGTDIQVTSNLASIA